MVLIVVTAFFAAAGIGVAVFLGLQLVGLATQSTGQSAAAVSDLAEKPATQQSTRDTQPEQPAKEAPADDSEPSDAAAESPIPGDEPRPPFQRPPQAEPAQPQPAPDQPDDSQTPAPREHDPFEDIKKRNCVLPLPELDRSAGGSSEPHELAKLFVPPGAECQLAILGSEDLLGRGRSFEINRQDSGGTPTWTVVQRVKNVPVTQEIGSFTITDDSLTFQWDPAASAGASAGRLRYCVLEMRLGGRSERCTLTEPREVEPAKVVPLTLPARADIDLASDTVPNLDLVRLDLQPQGFPEHEVEPSTGIEIGQTSTIRFLDGSNLEIDLKFESDKQSQALSFDTFLNVDQRTARGLEHSGRQKLTRAILENHRKVWSSERVAGLKAQLDKTQAAIQDVSETLGKHRAEQAAFRDEMQRRRPTADASDRTRKEYEEWLRKANDSIAQQQADDARLFGEARHLERDQLPEQKRAFEDASQQLRWREAVESVIAELGTNGVVEYQVYAEIEGQKVGLIQSKGFQEKDRSERDE